MGFTRQPEMQTRHRWEPKSHVKLEGSSRMHGTAQEPGAQGAFVKVGFLLHTNIIVIFF